MDDGPIDRPLYVNLNRSNGRRSNGPPMLPQFGPSKTTVMDRYFGQLKNMVVNRNFGPSKIMVGDRNLEPLKFTKKNILVKVVVNKTVGQLVAI